MIDISETLIEPDSIKITRHRHTKGFDLSRDDKGIIRYKRSRCISIKAKLTINYLVVTVFWYYDLNYWMYSVTSGGGVGELWLSDMYKITKSVEYLKEQLRDNGI